MYYIVFRSSYPDSVSYLQLLHSSMPVEATDIFLSATSPLSDMSPATSDCLETYFSGGFILFSNYRVCVDFSGYFYLFLICVPFLGS